MAYANSPSGFKFEFSTAGGYPTLHEGKVNTNVSLAAGDAIIVLTTGLIGLALSTSALIEGVAAHAITGAAGVKPKLQYYPASPTNVFSIQTNGIMSQSYIGSYRSIEGATGVMALDLADAAPGVCQVIGFKRGYTTGTYGHALVIFRNSQFTGQS